MHSSNVRQPNASYLFGASAARIKRGTAEQATLTDTLGLSSVHTIYPRRRRSGLSQLLRASRASILPVICGVATAYILLIGAPFAPSPAQPNAAFEAAAH